MFVIETALAVVEFIMEHDLDLMLEIGVLLVALYTLSLAWRISFSDCDLSVRGYTMDPAFVKGKVVWVVGASSGIGKSLALRAAAAGATVVVSARRKERLTALANEIDGNQFDQKLHVLPLDVTDRAACRSAVEQIGAKYGRCDVVALNAGLGAECLAEEMSIQNAADMFELNVLSCIHLTQLLIPLMRRSSSQGNRPVLLVTSSIAGKMPSPAASCYSASKHAVQGYFNCVRLEVLPFMDVTLACPGPVDTEFGQARLVGKDKPGAPKKYGSNYMSSDRCAEIMLTAASRGVPEVWAAPQPFLWYVYVAVYLPGVFAIFLKRKATKMLAAKSKSE